MNLQQPLEFLMHLQVNNDRNWFKENEKLYQNAKTLFENYIDTLIVELKRMDDSIDVAKAKDCTFRIFRDVRFSHNKEPYKTNFGAFIARGGRKSPYAGYYIHLQPDESFLGGGIYMPQAAYLNAIRQTIFRDPESFKAIIFDPGFRSVFGEIFGEKLKTAPKGFPKDWPDIDLIRNKHYAVSHPVDNEFWVESDPVEGAMEVFQKQYEFNQYLNRIVEKKH
jgi:uncharacterized protein (TIGR02453 family)